MVKFKLSRELLDMKKQEKIYFSVKDYDMADSLRKQAEKLETQERGQTENQLFDLIDKAERLARSKQQLSLASLLKRIQRDRDEQLNHRQQDSERLIQRNNNLLKDIMNKQVQEHRRTEQFLKYALGKREPKSEDEIMQGLKTKQYQPHNDLLMGRISKKYNRGGGTNLNSVRSMSS